MVQLWELAEPHPGLSSAPSIPTIYVQKRNGAWRLQLHPLGRPAGIRDVVRRVPLARTLLETDGPYMAPEPHRGAQGQPSLEPPSRLSPIPVRFGLHSGFVDTIAHVL